MDKLMKDIKNYQLSKEAQLSKYATQSKEYIRLNPEEDNDLRTPFARDIDRIIHSEAYSRYIDKTQVFIENNNDHITHRIIHVTLVAKVAKTIGRALNLNEDLIEAIALGHDIGHTPFGHLGETFLNELSLTENNKLFSHNIHSVRTLMAVENDGKGLNLCIQTLDGIMCHNGELVENIYRPHSKTKKDFLTEYELSYTDKNTLKKLRPMTLEGCVVRISDIVGYIGRDIEDAIKLNRFNRKKLPLAITTILGDNNKDIVNTIILDIITNSYNKPYIKMSEAVFNAITALKAFNYDNIYKNAYTKTKRIEYKHIFYKSFYFYQAALMHKDKNIEIVKYCLKETNQPYFKNNEINQIVLDYIAGSTDDFLIAQYQKYITNFVDKKKKR